MYSFLPQLNKGGKKSEHQGQRIARLSTKRWKEKKEGGREGRRKGKREGGREEAENGEGRGRRILLQAQ